MRSIVWLALWSVGVGLADSGADDKVVKLLESWVRSYRSGKLELNGKPLMGSSIGVTAGLIPKDEYRSKTHEDELRALCDAVADVDSVAAARALLTVAAAGLDADADYTPQMNPALVRAIGEAALDRLTTRDARYEVARVAGARATRSSAAAERMAALRALGRSRDARFRAVIEAALTDPLPLVRLHAADAICAGQFRRSLPAVMARLESESDPRVTMRVIDAIRGIYEGNRTDLADQEVAAVATTVGEVVGTAGWRTDLAAVQLLAGIRRRESVGPLIRVLARFAAAADSRPLGDDLSGVVRHRAYDALVAITGAPIAMGDAQRWADWWVSAEATFTPVAETLGPRGNTTSGGEFFGVPVEGSRVLFIVDTSESMAFPKTGKVGGRLTGAEPKLAVAKHELSRAVAKLPPGSQFNVVQFGTAARAWQKALVPNDEKQLKRFERYLEKLTASGGTNVWAGLELGLQIRSFAHGETFGVDVDEVFLLSDGLPSPLIGSVWEPGHVVRLIEQANSYAKAKINTIYIAGDPEEEQEFAVEIGMSGAELMQTIAEQNGGTFVRY